MRENYRNAINLTLWPLPPDYKLISTEVTSKINSSDDILNIGIYGDSRFEKNMVGQLDLYERVHK